MTKRLDQRIKRIVEKLIIARKHRAKCVGSHAHRFKLNPRLTEKRIADFERRMNIRLPEDYRAFLLRVGNGGAGPYYGILPLDQWFDLDTREPVEFGNRKPGAGCIWL